MNGQTESARETWLYALADELRPIIAETGHDCGPLRIGVGFTSGGRRSRAIGECWSPSAASDSVPAIFLRPTTECGVSVAATLLHEMIHAAVGLDAKHGPKFRKCAIACGLTGKMTATVAGPELEQRLHALVDALGPYPHAKLADGATSGKPKQSTRMLKVVCPDCGYTVRTTRQWLDVGTPTCPCGSDMEEG